MGGILTAARKDLKRRLADLPALVLWLGIPVVIGLLLALISGGSSQPTVPRARVLIVDLDGGAISQLLTGLAGSGRVGEFLELERVSLEEGEARIAAGRASALLVLPEGFSQSLLDDTPATLRLVTNPAQRLLPGIVQEGLEVLVETVFYAQRLLQTPLEEVRAMPDGGPSNAQVAAVAVAVNERLRELEGVLWPPVLTLVDEEPAADGAVVRPLNLGVLFVPGMLLMSMLFIANGTSGDLWEEKRLGTLRRARALPWPTWHWLAGKLLASSALVAAIAAVALAVAWLAFDVDAARLLLAFGWTSVTGVALLCYFALLQVTASTERGAQLLGTLVVFPLMMLGGSFFPFEAMPPWMAAIGRWTPNGLAVVRLREILDGRVEPATLIVSGLVLLLPALLAFWLTSRRLAGRFPVA